MRFILYSYRNTRGSFGERETVDNLVLVHTVSWVFNMFSFSHFCFIYYSTIIAHRLLSVGRCWCCALYCSHQNPDNDLLEGSVRESSRRKKKTILEYVIEFFDGWFFRNIVTHKYVRWFVLVVSAVIIGVAISFATQLEPDREQVGEVFSITWLSWGGGGMLT